MHPVFNGLVHNYALHKFTYPKYFVLILLLQYLMNTKMQVVAYRSTYLSCTIGGSNIQSKPHDAIY